MLITGCMKVVCYPPLNSDIHLSGHFLTYILLQIMLGVLPKHQHLMSWGWKWAVLIYEGTMNRDRDSVTEHRKQTENHMERQRREAKESDICRVWFWWGWEKKKRGQFQWEWLHWEGRRGLPRQSCTSGKQTALCSCKKSNKSVFITQLCFSATVGSLY